MAMTEMMNIQAYNSPLEHLADELKRIDLRLKMLYIKEHREDDACASVSGLEQLKGLVVTEGDVEKLLNGLPHEDNDSCLITLERELNELSDLISRKKSLSNAAGIFLPLEYMVNSFNLSPFEEQSIVLCLAPEIDLKYEKLYSYLQDDVTKRRPTVNLLLELLCASVAEKLSARLFFQQQGLLLRYFLKWIAGTETKYFLNTELKLDDRIVDYILGQSPVDGLIEGCVEFCYPGEDLPELVVGREIQDKIAAVASSRQQGQAIERGVIFHLYGPAGAGKKLQVKHFCRNYGQTLMLVDLEQALALNISFEKLMYKISREAVLERAVICFYNFQILALPESEAGSKINDIIKVFKYLAGVFFVLSVQRWKYKQVLDDYSFIAIEMGIPGDAARKCLWESYSCKYNCSGAADWGSMAAKFRFTPGQIKNAIASAKHLSGAGGIEPQILYNACYNQAHHKLEQLAVRVKPVYSWEDIILLPDQKELLKNACNQMKYRYVVYGEWGFERKLSYGKGLSMLFSGPPGTGKTMSAQVVANELNLELYKINLSRMVSKYIGETEKNLQQVFDEAQYSSAILFFDEADALFGKRSEVKDAHDRYANIETAFLLQKMEEYEGITIMATNLLNNVDDAFTRRISFIIEFPFPNAEYREKIWRAIFPREAPLGEDVDYRFLAQRFELAGGEIKNIAVASAFLAAEGGDKIGMEHIIRAVKYELQKTGKILLKEDLGEYSQLVSL